MAPLEGEYEPSPWDWVREQVAEYEASGGTRANTLRDTGLPIIIVTTRGNKSGKLRKTALMRVEHDGEYALVASVGGAPKHPVWYHNLVGDPTAVTIQDGPEPFDAVVREVAGADITASTSTVIDGHDVTIIRYSLRTDHLAQPSTDPGADTFALVITEYQIDLGNGDYTILDISTSGRTPSELIDWMRSTIRVL
jgi:F420H(2)-dependent quinone reductase